MSLASKCSSLSLYCPPPFQGVSISLTTRANAARALLLAGLITCAAAPSAVASYVPNALFAYESTMTARTSTRDTHAYWSGLYTFNVRGCILEIKPNGHGAKLKAWGYSPYTAEDHRKAETGDVHSTTYTCITGSSPSIPLQSAQSGFTQEIKLCINLAWSPDICSPTDKRRM